MSSEGSRSSGSSRLSQFGIYKTIDERTEEFLRLSRRRQLRQGCACAALSTAITVTIVVIILLIYEYAIAVDSSLVQSIRNHNNTNVINDTPIADRLDRSYFGFDQDYFEKMPLLVNALQENSDIEPTIETTTLAKPTTRYIITKYSKTRSSYSNFKPNMIRRTSPRPFYFEYKSPTPTPFSKTYGSKIWVDNYRNAQRMKNLQQVIKYLEKTINAKFGDLYTIPTSTIAFSGLYVEPVIKEELQPRPTFTAEDLVSQDSNRIEMVKSNHKSDLFYSFKPESPGDVNLLADGFFRFSPMPTPAQIREKFGPNIPMFRPVVNRKRPCIGLKCLDFDVSESKLLRSQETKDLNVDATTFDKPKTFSVMLNLFPLKNDIAAFMETTPTPVHKIYITTPKPVIQFRRRSTTPIRRTITRLKKPRLLVPNKLFKTVDFSPLEKQDFEPKMIVHVNVYPPPEIKDQLTTESNVHTTLANPPRYSTQMPMLTSTQVEDFHIGSSGIIPPEARLTPFPPPPPPTPIPTLPYNIDPITTTVPYLNLETTSSSTEANFQATAAPEILKFSHEDAKVPDHYKNLYNLETPTSSQPEINRRISTDSSESNAEEDEYYETETSTPVTKLLNELKNSTQEAPEKSDIDKNETTTIKTYVPQINGHYRSVNQNSRNINTWLNDNLQSNRKRRLEMSVTAFRKSTYVPQYVEIKRNNTRNASDNDKET